MNWIYYNLIILITWCKIPYKNLDEALLFSRNQVFCLKIWKLWRVQTILQFNIFCWNFPLFFYLPLSTKECVGFCLFYLDIELFEKAKKDLFSAHSFFTLFLTTEDLNKIRKYHTPFCRYHQVENVYKISAKNIKLYGGWSSSNFQFFRQKPGFLEIIEDCLNLGIGFCITWLVLLTYKKISL